MEPSRKNVTPPTTRQAKNLRFPSKAQRSAVTKTTKNPKPKKTKQKSTAARKHQAKRAKKSKKRCPPQKRSDYENAPKPPQQDPDSSSESQIRDLLNKLYKKVKFKKKEVQLSFFYQNLFVFVGDRIANNFGRCTLNWAPSWAQIGLSTTTRK